MELFGIKSSLGFRLNSLGGDSYFSFSQAMDITLVVSLFFIALFPAIQLFQSEKLSFYAKISATMVFLLGANLIYASVYPENGPAPLVSFLSNITSDSSGGWKFQISPISLSFIFLMGAMIVDSKVRQPKS